MSSSEASTSSRPGPATRRAVLRAMVLGLAAAGVTGCSGGFQPLYGSLGAGTEGRLAKIDISTIPGRNGQRIRNELIFKLYGGQAPVTSDMARYRLEVAIKESATTTLVTRDGTSGGQIWQIDARFQLIEISTKRVLLEGNSQARATSERFANVFSNVRASEEAAERASKTIATDLKARLAGFMSTVQG